MGYTAVVNVEGERAPRHGSLDVGSGQELSAAAEELAKRLLARGVRVERVTVISKKGDGSTQHYVHVPATKINKREEQD